MSRTYQLTSKGGIVIEKAQVDATQGIRRCEAVYIGRYIRSRGKGAFYFCHVIKIFMKIAAIATYVA